MDTAGQPAPVIDAQDDQIEFLNLTSPTQGVALKLSQNPIQLSPSHQSNQLALSNIFALLLATNNNGFSLFSLSTIHSTLETAEPHSTPEVTPIAQVNTNGVQVDFVRFAMGDKAVLAGLRDGTVVVWRTQNLVNGNITPTTTIPVSPGPPLLDLLPNPAPTSPFLACLTPNATLMYNLNTQSLHATLPPCTSACWSVKGKQITLAFPSPASASGAALGQFTSEGEQKALVPLPPSLPTEDGWRASSIDWLENSVWLVTFAKQGDESDFQVFTITKVGKGEGWEFVNFFDPNPPFGMENRDGGRRWVGRLKNWEPFKHLLFMASGPSTEISALGQMSSYWATFALPDSSRPALPSSDSGDMTCPLGLEVDLTSTKPVYVGLGEDRRELPPCPHVLAYTSEGVLVVWRVVCDPPAPATPSRYSGLIGKVYDINTEETIAEQLENGTVAPPVAPPAAKPSPSPFGASTSTPNPFVVPGSSSSSPFGGPGFGSTPSAFGSSSSATAFGSTGFGSTSAFGTAPSAFGSTAFGGSSSTSSPSPFGGSTSSTSVPAAFKAPAAGGFAGFGAASASAFGASVAGSSSNGGNSSSPFGSGSAFGSSSGFGASAKPFGSSTTSTTGAGGFGAFAGSSSTTSTSTPSAFGTPTQPGKSVFGSSTSTTPAATSSPSAFGTGGMAKFSPASVPATKSTSSAFGGLRKDADDSDDGGMDDGDEEDDGRRVDDPPDLDPTKSGLDIGAEMAKVQPQKGSSIAASTGLSFGGLGLGGTPPVAKDGATSSVFGATTSSVFGAKPAAPTVGFGFGSSPSTTPGSTVSAFGTVATSPSPFGPKPTAPAAGATPNPFLPSPNAPPTSFGFGFGNKTAPTPTTPASIPSEDKSITSTPDTKPATTFAFGTPSATPSAFPTSAPLAVKTESKHVPASIQTKATIPVTSETPEPPLPPDTPVEKPLSPTESPKPSPVTPTEEKKPASSSSATSTLPPPTLPSTSPFGSSSPFGGSAAPTTTPSTSSASQTKSLFGFSSSPPPTPGGSGSLLSRLGAAPPKGPTSPVADEEEEEYDDGTGDFDDEYNEDELEEEEEEEEEEEGGEELEEEGEETEEEEKEKSTVAPTPTLFGATGSTPPLFGSGSTTGSLFSRLGPAPDTQKTSSPTSDVVKPPTFSFSTPPPSSPAAASASTAPAFSFNPSPASTTPSFSFGGIPPSIPVKKEEAKPAAPSPAITPKEAAKPASPTTSVTTPQPTKSPFSFAGLGGKPSQFGSMATSSAPKQSSPLSAPPSVPAQTAIPSPLSLGSSLASASPFGTKPASPVAGGFTGFASPSPTATSPAGFSAPSPKTFALPSPLVSPAGTAPKSPAFSIAPPPAAPTPGFPLSQPTKVVTPTVAPQAQHQVVSPSTPQPRAVVPIGSTSTPKLGTELAVVKTPGVVETGMGGEFLKVYLLLEKEFELLRKNTQVCKAFVKDIALPCQSGGRPVTDSTLFDEKTWSMGDLKELVVLTDQVRPLVEKLVAAALVQKREAAELQSALLKAETKREEAARFLRAKSDPVFAKMVRVRQLGPEQAENQKKIRLSVEAVRTRLEQVEDHLAALREKVIEERLGRSSFKAPTLDSVNRAVRNITVALTDRTLELDELSLRLDLLRLQPHSPDVSVISKSRLASPARDESFSSSIRVGSPRRLATPLGANKISRSLVKTDDEDPESAPSYPTGAVKKVLLRIRPNPLLNVAAVSNQSASAVSRPISDLQSAFAAGPITGDRLPRPRRPAPPPPPPPAPAFAIPSAQPFGIVPAATPAAPQYSLGSSPFGGPSPSFALPSQPAFGAQPPGPLSTPTQAPVWSMPSQQITSGTPPPFPSFKAPPTISFAMPTTVTSTSPSSSGSARNTSRSSRQHSNAVQLRSVSGEKPAPTSTFDWGPLPTHTPPAAPSLTNFMPLSSPSIPTARKSVPSNGFSAPVSDDDVEEYDEEEEEEEDETFDQEGEFDEWEGEPESLDTISERDEEE